MKVSGANIGCGVETYFGLDPVPEKNIEAIASHYWYSKWEVRWIQPCMSDLPGCILFSDRNTYKHGIDLAAYIRKHKLGNLTETKFLNPVHRSKCTVWAWEIDRKQFVKHVKKYIHNK